MASQSSPNQPHRFDDAEGSPPRISALDNPPGQTQVGESARAPGEEVTPTPGPERSHTPESGTIVIRDDESVASRGEVQADEVEPGATRTHPRNPAPTLEGPADLVHVESDAGSAQDGPEEMIDLTDAPTISSTPTASSSASATSAEVTNLLLGLQRPSTATSSTSASQETTRPRWGKTVSGTTHTQIHTRTGAEQVVEQMLGKAAPVTQTARIGARGLARVTPRGRGQAAPQTRVQARGAVRVSATSTSRGRGQLDFGSLQNSLLQLGDAQACRRSRDQLGIQITGPNPLVLFRRSPNPNPNLPVSLPYNPHPYRRRLHACLQN